MLRPGVSDKEEKTHIQRKPLYMTHIKINTKKTHKSEKIGVCVCVCMFPFVAQKLGGCIVGCVSFPHPSPDICLTQIHCHTHHHHHHKKPFMYMSKSIPACLTCLSTIHVYKKGIYMHMYMHMILLSHCPPEHVYIWKIFNHIQKSPTNSFHKHKMKGHL